MTARDRAEQHAALRALVDDITKGNPQPEPGELPSCWAALTAAGLASIGVDESAGGTGGDVADLVAIAYALGRNGVSAPLIETSTARWAMTTAGWPTIGELHTVALGRATPIPWARHAVSAVLVDGDEVAVVALAGRPIACGISIAGEPLDAVDPGTPQDILLAPDLADGIRARLAVLRAAALVGAAQAAYDLTRGYVAQRVQFGRPLIEIPAVAGHLARMKIAVIEADAALARAVDGPLRSAVAARLVAARTATDIARTAHQLHGAMGITAEYSLHRLTRRLWAWRDADLDQREWSLALGRAAVVGGEAHVWDLLTS